MKRNDLAEIKKADAKTLNERVIKLYKEIRTLSLDKNMGKLKDKKEIKNKRHDLAQILTVKRQKDLLETLETKEVKNG